MDFNRDFEKQLDDFITCISRERYNNDIRKIKYLQDLNVSLNCIGTFLNGKTGSQVHHYKTKKNKISELTSTQLDNLIKYTLSRMKEKMNKREDLSKGNIVELNRIIEEGYMVLGKQKHIVRQPNQVFIGRG